MLKGRSIWLIIILIVVLILGIITLIFYKAKDKNGNKELNEDGKKSQEVVLSEEEKLERKLEKILKSMTLEEKIGEMVIGGINGTELSDEAKDFIKNYKPSGIILYGDNMKTPEDTVKLLNEIKKENHDNKLPMFLSVDQEGGRVSKLTDYYRKFQSSKEVGDTNNSTYAFEMGRLLGRQAKSLGFNLNYAPVLDINSNPNNPVIGDRAFGDNEDIVSKMGIEVMKGLQSEKVIPSVKHFPGHGDTDLDSHLELPVINKSLKELENFELKPFKNAIENGVDLIMVAHILMKNIDTGYPASMSREIITGILREDLNYDGVVITDDLTMKAITNEYDIGTAAINSVDAGSDLLLIAHDTNLAIQAINKIKEAVNTGKIKEERIDESIKRIIKLKLKYNLKDEVTKNPSVEDMNNSIEELISKYK